MRYRTIWTLNGLPFRERLSRTKERVVMDVAHHLPKRLKYWVVMLELGRLTKDSPNVPGTTVDDILRQMNK